MKSKPNSYHWNKIQSISTILLLIIAFAAIVNTIVYAQNYTSYGNWSYVEESLQDVFGINLAYVWSNWTFAITASGSFNTSPSVTHFNYGYGCIFWLGGYAAVYGVYNVSTFFKNFL